MIGYESIVHYAQVIPVLKEIVEHTHELDGHLVRNLWKEISPFLAEMSVADVAQDGNNRGELISELQKSVLCVAGLGDISLKGAVIENELLPLVKEYIQSLGTYEMTTEDGRYTLCSSNSGFLTVRDASREGIYLHSSEDPVTEARHLAKRFYRPDWQEVALLGCGLGYLAYEFYKISDGILKITIFEDDMDMADMALAYGCLGKIPQEQLSILSGETEGETVEAYLDYPSRFSHRVGSYAYYWYTTDTAEKVRIALERKSLIQYSENRSEATLDKNTWANLYEIPHYATELVGTATKKEWIVVGGGPSVDDCISFIKVHREKYLVVAVTTIMRKLLKEGIRPDYLVVQDCWPNEYKHMEGLEKENIPMIIGPSTYWRCAKNYEGPKYLAPLGTNGTMVSRLYRQGLPCWNSGGSVSLLAIEFAVRMGAEEISLLGLDYGYPGGNTHATGTSLFDKVQEADYINGKRAYRIPAVDGGTVLTTEEMDLYRVQTEEMIAKNREIVFYNLSKHGAKINGAEAK